MAPLSAYNDVYPVSFCVNKKFCYLFFYCLSVRYGGAHVSVLKLRFGVRTSEVLRGSTSDTAANKFCSSHYVSLGTGSVSVGVWGSHSEGNVHTSWDIALCRRENLSISW
jgi:hypothetical protein